MVKKPGSSAAQRPNQALKDLAATDPASMGRLKQLSMTVAFVRKSNPRALPISLGSGLAVLAALTVAGLLAGSAVFLVLDIILGLVAATFTPMAILSYFARKAPYA